MRRTTLRLALVRALLCALALVFAPLLGLSPTTHAATATPQVSAGVGNTCALRTNGAIVCWGDNFNGQSTPPADLGSVTNISVGIFLTCAVKSDTTVACWGSTRLGGIPPAGLTGVTQVSATFARACAVKNDSTVVCWGFGDSENTPPAGLTGVIQVGTGDTQSCAVKNDGTVVCWGQAAGYAPGNLTGVTQLDSFGQHVCAVKGSEGSVVCWGTYITDVNTPPTGLAGVIQVDMGSNLACALKRDGTVACWGDPSNGRTIPPAALTGVVQLSSGENHTCAVKNDGTVVCWGYGGGEVPPAGLDLDNQSPTGISLSPTSVAENQPSGSVVGTLSTSDPDTGDAFTYTLVSGGGSADNGQFTIAGSTLKTAASFDFEIKASYTIRVRSTDRNGAFTEQPFTISVTDVVENVTPVANNDTASTNEDTPVIVAVLANDTDADGDALTPSIVTGPSQGQTTVNANGTITYMPNANYSGPDSFTYKVNDGTVDSNVATVTLTVNAVNDAPVASTDSYSTAEDTPLTISSPGMLSNDSDPNGDPLTAVQVSDPAHGTLALNANGSFTYTPAAGYNGPDSFTYKANDGALDSNVATVNLTVDSVNDTPTATDDSYSPTEDAPFTVAAPGVLANDSDPDAGATLTAVLVSGPSHAAAFALNSDGSFSYTPVTAYIGPDSFTYRVSDGTTLSNVATASLSVKLAGPPTCNGLAATIYVKRGVIVGGPDNGKAYKGKLKGTTGSDVIVGTDGKDTVDAKAGDDTICGLAGDDKLTGDDGTDYIDGGTGKDTLKGSSGNDVLLGGDNDDKLDGDDGNDTLDGGAGNDFLDGDKNNDTLTGGSGKDTFKGGDGTDTATDVNASEGDTTSSIP